MEREIDLKIHYYDKNGESISNGVYFQLSSDPAYRIIKKETLGRWKVSTVWLGMDHNFSDDGNPLIFETMVFPNKGDGMEFSEDYCQRYSTEEEAIKGHEEAVEKYKQGNET